MAFAATMLEMGMRLLGLQSQGGGTETGGATWMVVPFTVVPCGVTPFGTVRSLPIVRVLPLTAPFTNPFRPTPNCCTLTGPPT